MLTGFKQEMAALLSRRILEVYDLEHEPATEVPPRRELGDLAFPAPLHLRAGAQKEPAVHRRGARRRARGTLLGA